MEDYKAEDIDLIENEAFLLHKNEVLKMLIEDFSRLASQNYQAYHARFEVSPEPKVNRGENYKGLPYLVMDYPRTFTEQDVFAFRTLFWWGNYVSCTLHLKGKFLAAALPILSQKLKEPSEFKMATHGNEWNHDLNDSQYSRLDFKQISDPEFLKISQALPLAKLNTLDNFYEHCFNQTVIPLIS